MYLWIVTAVFFCCRLALHFAAVGIVTSKSINISFGISLVCWLTKYQKNIKKVFFLKKYFKFYFIFIEVKKVKRKKLKKKFECLWNIEEFLYHVKSVSIYYFLMNSICKVVVSFYFCFFFNLFIYFFSCRIISVIVTTFLKYKFFYIILDVQFCAFPFTSHSSLSSLSLSSTWRSKRQEKKQLSPVLLIMMLWDFIIY